MSSAKGHGRVMDCSFFSTSPLKGFLRITTPSPKVVPRKLSFGHEGCTCHCIAFCKIQSSIVSVVPCQVSLESREVDDLVGNDVLNFSGHVLFLSPGNKFFVLLSRQCPHFIFRKGNFLNNEYVTLSLLSLRTHCCI